MTGKKTKFSRVQEIFRQVPESELLSFFQKELLANNTLVDRLLINFSYLWEDISKSDYTNIVRTGIMQDRLKGQLSDHHRSKNLKSELKGLLILARRHCAEKNWRDSFEIVKAIIQEVGKAGFEFMNSHEYAGDSIREAIEIISNLFDHCQVASVKDEILQFANQLVYDRKYETWNIDRAMFDFLINQTWTNDFLHILKETCLDRLDQVESDFEVEKFAIDLIHLCYISKDNELLNQTLIKYSHFNKVQWLRLDQLLAEGDFEEAILVGEQGLRKALDERRYQEVLTWQRQLLAVADAQDNIRSQEKYCYQIYLSETKHDRNIFQKLRALHFDRWSIFRERLLKELDGVNPDNISKRAEIYRSENMLYELLQLLIENPHLVKKYGSFLHDKYPRQILEVYRVYLENYLITHVGRKYYKRFCQELDQIGRLVSGGKDFAAGMIIRMKQEYKVRSALVEELNRLSMKYQLQ